MTEPASEPILIPVDEPIAEHVELLCRAQQLRERDVVVALLRYALINYEDALDECGPDSGTTYLID